MIRPITEKQAALIVSLCDTLYGTDGPAKAASLIADSPTVSLASGTIDALIALRKARPASAAPTVVEVMPEPGYYAVPVEGVLKFFTVREGTGRWEGRRFLNRYRSDYLDRPGAAERKAAVAAILADPHDAALTFARETVRCFTCGRRLTDAVSRAAGQGPDCRGRTASGTLAGDLVSM
jgi:hypothetical protein